MTLMEMRKPMPLMTLTEYGAIRTMHEYSPEQVADLERRLRVRDRQLEAVRQISAALYSQNSIDNLLQETLTVALRTVDAETGSILLYDPAIKRLKFRYWKGDADLSKVEIDPETDLQGKAASVFRAGRPLITHDTLTEGYNPAIDQKTGFHTRNMLTVPIISSDMTGTVLGVLQAVNKRYEPFNHDDSDLLEIISTQAAVFLANARLAEEAQLAAVAKAAGDISHDVGNYLTPIISQIKTLDEVYVTPMYEKADALYHDWKDNSPEHAAALDDLLFMFRSEFPYTVQAIDDSCADIKELVSEIADYIKGTAGVNKQPNNIGDVIGERLRRLRTVASGRRSGHSRICFR
jgi:K+-sensing histidine kinase KdpD